MIPSFPKLAISFILFGELVHRAIGLVRHPDVPNAWDTLAWIAAIVLIVGTYRQVQLIKLRVISDTMRIRLERMAPQDRLDAISRLSIPDLVVRRKRATRSWSNSSGSLAAGMRRRFPDQASLSFMEGSSGH